MEFVVRGTKYEIDQDRLTFAEARAIERVVGLPFDKLDQSSLTATQAMIWVAMKRADPALKFTDLDDLEFGDFEIIEADVPEVEADPTATRAAAALTRNFDAAGVLDDGPGGPSTATPPAT